MSARALLAGAVLALTSLSAAAENDVVRLAPLHVIPTENPSAKPLAPDATARVRLTTSDPKALADVLGASAKVRDDGVEYVFGAYPQLKSTATRTWLEPTFVIDFEEPAFEPLRKELAARGAKTTRPQLVKYVADLIEESSERAWDLASVVAKRRRGDCSEHAVLTAALARLQGIPARVVVGAALVSEGENLGTFGHAWAEVLEDGEWAVADAALVGLEGTVRYLPVGLIEDEGMGYAMELMRLMQIWIDRVVVLGT